MGRHWRNYKIFRYETSEQRRRHMKKLAVILLAAFLVMTFVGVSFATKENTGCGLGYIIFKGKDGLLSQTFAATTNGTFGNQTFGISSGTSECDRPSSFTANEKLNKFASDNMDNLAMDIARGQGEYLNTLAVLLEVPENERASFYTKLQTHFSDIYTSETVTHVDVLRNIETVVTSG
jgi:hypothetical protein